MFARSFHVVGYDKVHISSNLNPLVAQKSHEESEPLRIITEYSKGIFLVTGKTSLELF